MLTRKDRMKKILVLSLLLSLLLVSCMNSSTGPLSIGYTGTIQGTVKTATSWSTRMGMEVGLDFVPVGNAKSVSWTFDYSGENATLANLMLIKDGDVVDITYKRIEAYPQEGILPTKDITGLVVNGVAK